MGTTVEIYLPPPLMSFTMGLWPKELSSNRYTQSRGALRRRAEVVKAYREEAGLVALGAGVRKPALERATVQAVCWWKDQRRPDGLNVPAALKPVFDGLTDAGVWVDDKHVDLLPVVFHFDKKNQRLEISVWEAQVHYSGELFS